MARKIKVEIIGDASSLERAFRKAGKDGDAFGRKMGGTLGSMSKGMLAVGGAAAGMSIAIGVKSVMAASDLGEQINKTSVVFGNSADEIQKWAETTAASIGISNRAALEFAGTFGNMLVPMGISRGKASDMSQALVKLAADMASFNNAKPEEVLEALRAGLAGETEPLRRFGIFLNQDRIAAEALSKGIVKTTKDLTKIKLATVKVAKAQAEHVKTVKKYGLQSLEAQESLAKFEYAQDQLTKAMKGTTPKLTAQEKAMATYSIIMGDTTDAQNDFARTSGSLPNIIRTIRAVVEDLSAAFGEGLLPVVQKAAKALSEKLANPAFKKRVQELGKVVGETLLRAFDAISDWFAKNWEGIKSGFKTAAELVKKVAGAVEKVYGWLKDVAGVTPGGAGTMVGVIMSGLLVTKIGNVIKKLALLQGALVALSNPYTATVVLTIVLGAAFYKFGPQVREKILKALGLNAGPGTNEVEVEVGVAKAAGSKVTKRSGPGRAKGGPAMGGGTYLIGERGPELLHMGRSSGYVSPDVSGGGVSIGVVHVHGVQNVRDLIAEIQRVASQGSAQQRGRYGGQRLALN